MSEAPSRGPESMNWEDFLLHRVRAEVVPTGRPIARWRWAVHSLTSGGNLSQGEGTAWTKWGAQRLAGRRAGSWLISLSKGEDAVIALVAEPVRTAMVDRYER